jgi:hypothetical protein
VTAPARQLADEIREWRRLVEELRAEAQAQQPPKLTLIRGGRDAG